jgi:DNA-binding MarR family transcriptional regulator
VEVTLDHSRADLRQAAAFDSNGIVELERLQEQLDQLRDKLRGPAEEGASSPLGSHEAAQVIREILRYRRRRERIFGNDLFGEPAWDILLELYLAELTYKKISVSAACLASAVPATTALRWISTLETRSFIKRQNDPMDRRRVWLRLTPQGSSAMRNYLAVMAVQPTH